MKDNKNKIPEIIYLAIEILKKCFGGTKVELISDSLIILEPSHEKQLYKKGVSIKIEGINLFLYLSLAEDIVIYGKNVAEELVYKLIKDMYPEKF